MNKESSNFTKEVVDLATKNGKPVVTYHFVIGYKYEPFSEIKYKKELNVYLLDYLINEYSNPQSNRCFCHSDGIKLTEFNYSVIKKVFERCSEKFKWGVIKMDSGRFNPDNKTAKPDWGIKNYSDDENEERMEIGVYEDNFNVDEFKEYFYNYIPDVTKEGITLFECRKVKSNPRKPKVECTDLVYDQFGVLIEKGDLIAYPKGGDHNYYYVRKDEVVENTPKFVKLKNGDMTKADKVIVIKAANPNKKVSF